jgi:hypothetical protein
MHRELRALNVGDLIGDFGTEGEAPALARQLIADGWGGDDLGLGLEWDDGEKGDDALLPPARYGATLLTTL